MALSDTAIRGAKPREKDWKLADERGLYLLVTPKGAKLWRLKFRHVGREKKLALGAYAWANLIDPTIVERVSIIDDDEQYLMTLAGGWLSSEFDLPIGICRDVIVRAVRKELVGQALDRMLPRAKGF